MPVKKERYKERGFDKVRVREREREREKEREKAIS
jgi:hypothetical protein